MPNLRPSPRQRHDPTKNLVGFKVGEVTYAVRIETVREIVRPLGIVGLPRAPESVRGVASFRGEVVPVIDLRVRFGLPPLASGSEERKHKWIILDVAPRPKRLPHEKIDTFAHERRFVALVVDSVTEVFGVGGEPLRPAPPLGMGDDVRAIEGVAHRPERGGLVFVLDVASFGPLAEAASRSLPPASQPMFEEP